MYPPTKAIGIEVTAKVRKTFRSKQPDFKNLYVAMSETTIFKTSETGLIDSIGKDIKAMIAK